MFTKIQPEQIQLPTFFSDSGDFAIVQNTDTGINFNLSRNLTGDFDITGSLSVNSRGLLTTDETNLFSPESGNSALGGSNNVVSGSYCAAVASRFSVINGVNNVDLNGSSSIFHSGSQDNVLVGGLNCIFASGITGAAIFSDKYSSTSARGSHTAVINFNSGLFIENETHFEDNFYVSPSVTGVFSGDLNILGVGYLTGSRIASEKFTTGEIAASILAVSGDLASQIGGAVSYAGKTGDYTLLSTDYLLEAVSGSFSFNLPTAVGIAGTTYVFKNSDTGTITISGDGSETIDGANTAALGSQYESITMSSNGASWLII